MVKDIHKTFLAQSLSVLNINVSSISNINIIFLIGAMFHKITKMLIIS